MKKLFCLALAVLMLLSMVACSKNEPNENSDEIVIALITNTTGEYAEYGVPVHNAAKMYIDQLNAKGGINGKKIKVLEYDDQADKAQSVNALNLAVQNGATAVLGSVLTGATIGLSDATYEINMPQITASATSEFVTVIEGTGEVRTNVFRSCFIDPFQGEVMASYISDKLGAKTVAVFYQTGSDYSEGVTAAFETACAKYGLEIVAKETFSDAGEDFSSQMTNIASKNPDAVFAPIYYGEAGRAISTARKAGVTATFVGGDGFGSVVNFATAEELEGTVYCSGYAPGTASVAQFEKDYKNTYGEDVPNMFAPLAYDAAMLLCKGLEAAEAKGLKAGSAEYKQAVIDAIKASDAVQGITGSYSFNEKNNPVKSVAIIEINSGVEAFKEMYDAK